MASRSVPAPAVEIAAVAFRGSSTARLAATGTSDELFDRVGLRARGGEIPKKIRGLLLSGWLIPKNRYLEDPRPIALGDLDPIAYLQMSMRLCGDAIDLHPTE